MLNVLIVDDEAPAHEVMRHHLAGHRDLSVVGQCYNAAEALAALDRHRVDLMLLDIRMPGFGGLDLLRGLQAPPLVIIVSAHRDHAVDGFELDVVDYLLKPVSSERFSAAIEKVRRRIAEAQDEGEADIVLKVDRAMIRFSLKDIACFQAQGNFVQVWTGAEQGMLATITLRALEERLSQSGFVRVHKSFIVNRRRITAQQAASLILDTAMCVPIGKNYRGKIPVLGERKAERAAPRR